MKILLLPLRLATLLSLVAAAEAHARTFTSTDGRTMEGEIRTADATTVTIRRSDGKDFKLPIASLSASSQADVSAWKNNGAMAKLTVTATKDKIAARRTGGAGTSHVADGKSQQWCWVITVNNGSALAVPATKMTYTQVVERTDRNSAGTSGAAKSAARSASGELDIPAIPAFGSVQVRTTEISVQAWRSTSSTTDGKTTTVTTYKWDEALSGLRVELLHEGRAVVNWKTGTDPRRKPAR